MVVFFDPRDGEGNLFLTLTFGTSHRRRIHHMAWGGVSD